MQSRKHDPRHCLCVCLLLGSLVIPGFTQAQSAEDYFAKGVESFGKSQLHKAEVFFLRAMLANGNDPRPYLALADVYLVQRRLETGLEVVQQGLERFDGDERLWLMKGLLLREQGDGRGAKAAYMQALDAAPQNIDVLNTVQNHLFFSGDVTEAKMLRERREQLQQAQQQQ